MEFAEDILKRIEAEDNPKKELNTLVCFSKKDTGEGLGKIVEIIAQSRAGKSSITLLNLIDQQQAQEIEDDNIYKSNLLSDIIKQGESEKYIIRSFVKKYDDYVNDILKTAEEYNSDLILIGVDIDVFDYSLWNKYLKLKTDNVLDEESYISELGEYATNKLRHISTILNRSDQSIGIFIPNKLEKIESIFIPILKQEDLFTLTYLFQLVKGKNIKAVVWDAIGIIANNPKIERIVNITSRKTDGIIKLWDNNKKISVEFMESQDLMIIGKLGWDRLIYTPLCWIHSLPSTLIIKDKK